MAVVTFDDDSTGTAMVWTEQGERAMTFAEFKAEVRRRRGRGIGLRVSGWSEVWACGWDRVARKVRAQCPTSETVTPIVETMAGES